MLEYIDPEERLTLQELESRYGISRSTLTNRMNRLGLVTIQEKKGHPGYLEGDAIAQLDDLHGYIKANGTQDGYPFPDIEETTAEEELRRQSALSTQHTSQIDVHPPTENLNTATTPGAGAGYSYINGQRVFQQGLVIATEQVMSQSIAQQYANNPHLLPPEYQAMITELQSNLKQGMPQPNHASPQNIAQMVLNQAGQIK